MDRNDFCSSFDSRDESLRPIKRGRRIDLKSKKGINYENKNLTKSYSFSKNDDSSSDRNDRNSREVIATATPHFGSSRRISDFESSGVSPFLKKPFFKTQPKIQKFVPGRSRVIPVRYIADAN